MMTVLPSCIDLYGDPCENIVIMVSIMDNLGGIGNYSKKVNIKPLYQLGTTDMILSFVSKQFNPSQNLSVQPLS